AVVSEELLHDLGALVVDDAHHPAVAGLAVFPFELDEFGMLTYAGHAPGGEEVDEDPLVGLGDVEGLPRDDVAGHRRGGLALDGGRVTGAGSRRSGREQHDEEGDDGADRDGGDERRPWAAHVTPTGSSLRSGTGAETGAIGRRRRPGKAARSDPTAMTPPPIQSQTMRGWTMILTETESAPGGSVMESMTEEVRVFFTVGLPMVWVPCWNCCSAGV